MGSFVSVLLSMMNKNNSKCSSISTVYQRRLKVYPSTRFRPPNVDMLRRVIGTTDVNGKGTVHPVERQVDPFFFMDEADMPPGFKPPFDSHPHTGLVACTYQLNEKFAGMLWDNHNQQDISNHIYHEKKNHDDQERKQEDEEKEKYYGPLWGRGLLQIFSGKGIEHDEGHPILPNSPAAKEWEQRFGECYMNSVASEDCIEETKSCDDSSFKKKAKANQNINSKKVNQWLLQLWFNPGIGGAYQRELDPAQVILTNPEQIPIIRQGDVTTRIIMGKYEGKESPCLTWDANLMVLDCTIMPSSDANQDNKKSSTIITLPDEYTTAWIFNVKPNEDDGTGSSILIKDHWQAGEYEGKQIEDSEEKDGETTNNQVLLQTQELAIREQIGVDDSGDDNSDPAKKQNIPIVAKSGTNKLEISLDSSSSSKTIGARFVIGAGKPFGLPWYKLLGNDGALIGPNEKYVRDKMKEYEANKNGFGL